MYTKDKKAELSVLVDRATGGASIKEGEIELMLHRLQISFLKSKKHSCVVEWTCGNRRTCMDDSRGVEESLEETVCVNNTCSGLTVWVTVKTVLCWGKFLIPYFCANADSWELLCKHKQGWRRSTVETRDWPGNILFSSNGIHTRQQGEMESLQCCQRSCNGSSLHFPSKRCSHHSSGAGARERPSPLGSSLWGIHFDLNGFMTVIKTVLSVVYRLEKTLITRNTLKLSWRSCFPGKLYETLGRLLHTCTQR